VPGYTANECLLTGSAAQALTKIQRELRAFGLSLKVLDCYRPQAAVNYFVRWAGNSSDASMRAQYYPRVAKTELIAKGDIASPSSHSRGLSALVAWGDQNSGNRTIFSCHLEVFCPPLIRKR